MTAQLVHKVLGNVSGATRTAYVVHGLLGSSANWTPYCRRLATAYKNWKFVVVDLREHGDSTGFAPPHTVPACVSDLLALFEKQGRPDAIIAHSFGGKIALDMIARENTGAPLHAWILDTAPGLWDATKDTDQDSVAKVLRFVKQTKAIESRQWLLEQCTAAGFTPGVAEWLSSNIKRFQAGHHGTADAAFQWKFSPEAGAQLLESYGSMDCWPVLLEPQTWAQQDAQVELVVGTKSGRWKLPGMAEPLAQLEAAAHPRSRVHTLHAGHWLHVDNPDGLQALLDKHMFSKLV